MGGQIFHALASKDPPKKPRALVSGWVSGRDGWVGELVGWLVGCFVRCGVFCSVPMHQRALRLMFVLQANWADLMLLYARRIGIDMSTDLDVDKLRVYKVVLCMRVRSSACCFFLQWVS